MQFKITVLKLSFYSKIWRLKWNILGNILATTAEDGVVRMWKVGDVNGRSLSTLRYPTLPGMNEYEYFMAD